MHKSGLIDSIKDHDIVSFEENEGDGRGPKAVNVKTIVTTISEPDCKDFQDSKLSDELNDSAISRKALESISENWKLEAKLETQKNYFWNFKEVDQIMEKNKCYIIGRKGSGKSSISEHILGLKKFDIFSEKLSFKNFPFNELYSLDNQKYTPPNQYITLWKYLIYSTVAKLMITNEKINAKVRAQLGEIYKSDPIHSLARTINQWTSAEFGAKIFGTGGTLKITRDIRSNATNWVERVNCLEDIILEFCDDAKYFIIFDELDEDYRSIKSEEHSLYNYLLTSLFKAVQDVNYTFNSTKIKVYPIVFLRDDIYSLIKDADKNKGCVIVNCGISKVSVFSIG